MSWSTIEKVLEESGKHSTFLGKFWLTIVFLFRLVFIMRIGDTIYHDEQQQFTCNIRQPGCTNVCFNSYSPLSFIRFAAFHMIILTFPVVCYLCFSAHQVLQDKYVNFKNVASNNFLKPVVEREQIKKLGTTGKKGIIKNTAKEIKKIKQGGTNYSTTDDGFLHSYDKSTPLDFITSRRNSNILSGHFKPNLRLRNQVAKQRRNLNENGIGGNNFKTPEKSYLKDLHSPENLADEHANYEAMNFEAEEDQNKADVDTYDQAILYNSNANNNLTTFGTNESGNLGTNVPLKSLLNQTGKIVLPPHQPTYFSMPSVSDLKLGANSSILSPIRESPPKPMDILPPNYASRSTLHTSLDMEPVPGTLKVSHDLKSQVKKS